MIVCYRTIDEVIKLTKLINIIPNISVISMKNMCTIFMNINSIRIVLVKIFTCKKSSTRVHF